MKVNVVQCKNCEFHHSMLRKETVLNRECTMLIHQCWVHGIMHHPAVLATTPEGFCNKAAYIKPEDKKRRGEPYENGY